MGLRISFLAVMTFLVVMIPGVLGGSISVSGGTTASISDSGSVQGALAADSNGATFKAGSTGFVDEFKKAQLLDFGSGSTIESEATIKDGSIDTYSEITKPTKLGTETSLSLVAEGSSVDVALSGLKDSSATGQRAGVGNGIISTSLNLAIGDSISAYQNTALIGDEGVLGSVAKSKTNNMAINGGFSGSGDLNAKLTTTASDSAVIYGTTSFNGVEVVNNNMLQAVANGELSVTSDGIYEDRKGDLGNFGVTATSIMTQSQNGEDLKYILGGWKWAAPIHYKLSTNLIGGSSSANANLWAEQISKGANEWDSNTVNANVFRGTDTVNKPGTGNVLEFTTKNPSIGTYQGGIGDGNNNYIAVSRAVKGRTIAVTYTWWYTNQYVTGGFKKAAESDVYFNGNMAWRVATAESTATNSKLDVRTIATHEVGHSLGLLDLYDSTDTDKIMYGYNNGQVKWSLRTADKLGLWAIYGQ